MGLLQPPRRPDRARGRPALMKRIDDLDVAGQVVLLRADLNVPLDGDVITDDGRIRASLPTIRALTGRGARVVICAHLGRPTGRDVRRPGRGRPVPAAGRRPAQRAARPARPAGRGRGRGVGRGPGGRAGRRRRRPAGERPVRAGRDEQASTPSGPGSRPGSPRWPPCTSAMASVPCTASTPACTTCPRCSRTPPGTWSSPRSRCSASSPPTRPGRMWWCSAAPSRRTSWRSSATCSAGPTG